MLQIKHVKLYVVPLGEDGNNDASEIQYLATLCLVPYTRELSEDKKRLIVSMLERELIYTEEMYKVAHQIFSEVSALIYRKRRDRASKREWAGEELLTQFVDYDSQISSLMKLQKIFRAQVTSDEQVA